MPTMIQIRNVPSDLHRKIKARAALAGSSMSDYLLREIRRTVERPTRDELLDRISELPVAELGTSATALVREERDRR